MQDFALLIDLFEVEITPVEEDLGVRLGHTLPLHAHVVSERRTHGADGFVEGENARRPLGREPLEDGQVAPIVA